MFILGVSLRDFCKESFIGENWISLTLSKRGRRRTGKESVIVPLVRNPLHILKPIMKPKSKMRKGKTLQLPVGTGSRLKFQGLQKNFRKYAQTKTCLSREAIASNPNRAFVICYHFGVPVEWPVPIWRVILFALSVSCTVQWPLSDYYCCCDNMGLWKSMGRAHNVHSRKFLSDMPPLILSPFLAAPDRKAITIFWRSCCSPFNGILTHF